MRLFRAAGCLALAAMLIGCNTTPEAAPATVAPKSVSIGKGKSAHLMLLTPIESGDCPKGMVVNLALVDDLTDASGAVIFPAGTPFSAEVTWTRRAGAISPLINQPARLAIQIRPTLANGQTINWTADIGKSEPEQYEFTLENVGVPKADPKVEEALADAAKKELLRELAFAIESGSSPHDLEAKLKENPAFESLLSEMGYGKAGELIEKHGRAAKGFRRLVDSANELRDGNLSKLQGGEVALALAALEEAGNLANQITGTVRGIFKGRNIRARLGTKLTVYSADAHQLKTPVVVAK